MKKQRKNYIIIYKIQPIRLVYYFEIDILELNLYI